jgi:hypothetical protein
MKFDMVNIRWWEYMLLVFVKGYWVSTTYNGKLYIALHKKMFGTTYVIDVQEI